MALVFIAIDPDTTGDHCPAVFVEEETGDLLFQGWTVTDPQILSEVAQHSPVADNESVVRLPARMKAMILEALNGQGAAIRRAAHRPVLSAQLEAAGRKLRATLAAKPCNGFFPRKSSPAFPFRIGFASEAKVVPTFFSE